MGKGGGNTTSTVTQQNIPKEFFPYMERMLARGEAQSLEPYTPYAGQRLAGQTGDTLASQQMVRNLALQGSPTLDLATGLTAQGALGSQAYAGQPGYEFSQYQFDPTQTFSGDIISQYMNPYMQNVLDIQKMQAASDYQIAQQARNAQALGAGAFGGSRQAIAESELSRGTQRNIAETTAAERAKAYNQALEQFRKDQANIPALYAQMQGQLGTGLQQTQGAFGSMVNPLLQTGGLQQAREQANLDVLRQQYEEERDFPLRGITALRQTLGLSPQVLGVGTSQAGSQPGANPLTAVVGAINQGPKFIKNLKELGGALGL